TLFRPCATQTPLSFSKHLLDGTWEYAAPLCQAVSSGIVQARDIDGVSDQLISVVPEDHLELMVDHRYRAIGSHHQHAAWRGFHNQSEPSVLLRLHSELGLPNQSLIEIHFCAVGNNAVGEESNAMPPPPHGIPYGRPGKEDFGDADGCITGRLPHRFPVRRMFQVAEKPNGTPKKRGPAADGEARRNPCHLSLIDHGREDLLIPEGNDSEEGKA